MCNKAAQLPEYTVDATQRIGPTLHKLTDVVVIWGREKRFKESARTFELRMQFDWLHWRAEEFSARMSAKDTANALRHLAAMIELGEP